MKDEKDPTILKDFFSLVLLFSSAVTRVFPWPIKGKAGRPMKGIGSIQVKSEQTHRTPNTRLSSNRALSAPVHSFHQRLGIHPSLARL